MTKRHKTIIKVVSMSVNIFAHTTQWVQYSGVSVCGMKVNDPTVMSRKLDGWLNTTHIINVAELDQREATLGNVAQKGKHEKIQGSYEKDQGTWIDDDRSRALCAEYGVEQLLLPLLNAW